MKLEVPGTIFWGYHDFLDGPIDWKSQVIRKGQNAMIRLLNFTSVATGHHIYVINVRHVPGMAQFSWNWIHNWSTMIHSRWEPHPDRSTNSEDASASVVIGVGGLVDLAREPGKKKRVGWGSPQAMLMCHDVSSVSGILCSQQNQWCHPKHVVMPCYAIIQ